MFNEDRSMRRKWGRKKTSWQRMLGKEKKRVEQAKAEARERGGSQKEVDIAMYKEIIKITDKKLNNLILKGGPQREIDDNANFIKNLKEKIRELQEK